MAEFKLINHTRENFEGIYLDLSKKSGRFRLSEQGLGWKAGGGGDLWTLDKDMLISASWSRAAKGFELKIMAKPRDVIQLDGFAEEVRMMFVARLGQFMADRI
jgi:structure-specific recognition protein 1